MKKFLFALFACAALFCVALPAISCREKSKYKLKNCNEIVANEKKQSYETYGLKEQKHSYVKSYQFSNGLTGFFEEGLETQRIDEHIEQFDSIFHLLTETDIKAQVSNVYVGNIPVTYCTENALWVNEKDCIEQIFAILLAELDDQRYPFGIYAGKATHLLKESNSTSIRLYEEGEFDRLSMQYPTYKELQAPLFWRDFVTEEEYLLSWTYSYNLLQEFYLQASHPLSFAEYVAGLPLPTADYQFKINDAYYPVRLETKSISYYFCFDFKDPILKDTEFTLSYSHLTNLALEGEAFIGNTRRAFGREAPPPQRINAFFGQELLTILDKNGEQALGTSRLTNNQIICRSLAVFFHELTHQLLYFEEPKSYFKEELCDVFAHSSSLTGSYLFYVYSGQYIPQAEYDNFSEVLTSARSLYARHSSGLDVDTFQPEIWVDCLALSMNERESIFRLNCQTNSFVAYLYKTYGMTELNKLCDSLSATIDGKDFDALIAEWRTHLENVYAEK